MEAFGCTLQRHVLFVSTGHHRTAAGLSLLSSTRFTCCTQRCANHHPLPCPQKINQKLNIHKTLGKNLISKELVLILFSLRVDVCFQRLLYRVSNERTESGGVSTPPPAPSPPVGIQSTLTNPDHRGANQCDLKQPVSTFKL